MVFSHVNAASRYARGVIAGKVSACKWVKAACLRHLGDLEKQKLQSFPYRFDKPKAEDVCRFIETLRHIKGEWAGTPICLQPWQKFILCCVFGWVSKADGLRRFRTCYIEVPRKNAKSTISSAVGLYMLTADEEDGAEVYSAATTRDQAKIIFCDAQQMARKAPRLCENFGVQVNAHNINVLATASKFEALSADSSTLDGLNVHCGLIDELHAHKTRDVYDVIETATGSRRQPLLWTITTAGSNRAGICYEVRTYLVKVLNSVLRAWAENPYKLEGGFAEDETFFGVIHTIDDDDDWTTATAWKKANPNYGVSVKADDMARKCAKAMQLPSAVNNFLTKHLNVWVNADTSWMDMRAWDACADSSLCAEDFTGQSCIIGLDLASKVDLAAKVDLFWRDVKSGTGKTERHYYAFGRYYLPEEAAEDGRNSQYSGWVRDGRIVATPGATTDFAYIKEDLRDDRSRFEIDEVPFDPWQANQLAGELITEGFTMVEMRPTVQNFSEPMKELERLVLSGLFHHDGDPVLGWMVSNVVCHTDAKDNIYPRKERPENKIDGVVALVMALGRAIVNDGSGESVYEKRGVLAF